MTGSELIAIPAAALLQAALRADTMVAVAAPLEGWQAWVRVFADVATILIAVALIGVALAAIAAVLKLRSLNAKIGEVAQRMQVDVQPILKHATDVAENVNYVSSAIRGDVEEFKRTLASAQTRLTRASNATEQRIREFNALIRVVQEEAENLFIGTASTLRGVRAGVERLQEPDGEAGWHEDDDLAAPPGRRHNQ